MSRQRKNFKGTTVTVTKRDINKALRTGTNPISLATRRATARLSDVYGRAVELTYGSEIVAYQLPKRAIRLNENFVMGNTTKLKPLTFTLGGKLAA